MHRRPQSWNGTAAIPTLSALVALAPMALFACHTADITLRDGDEVAVGGLAHIQADLSRGDCIQVVGDSCDPTLPIDDGEVRSGDAAEFVPTDDGGVALRGLSPGEVRVRVTFRHRDRTYRRTEWFEVQELQRMHASVDGERISGDGDGLTLDAGESITVTTTLHGEEDWQVLAGDGLHGLTADSDLVQIEGDGGPEHVLTAAETGGETQVRSLELDTPLFTVRVHDTQE